MNSMYPYLFCSAVNILHVNENSDCFRWPLLQHLFHHILVFWEVLNIARVSLTWANGQSQTLQTVKRNDLRRRWNLHLTGVMPTICNLKFVTNVVLCKESSEKVKVVGFGHAESVWKLLRLDVFLGSFLLVSLSSNMHSQSSNNRNGKISVIWLWAVACTWGHCEFATDDNQRINMKTLG